MQTVPGKGAALRAGLAEAATGDVVVMLDADGSTNPDEISAICGGTDARRGLCQGLAVSPWAAVRTTCRGCGGSETRALVRLTNVLFGTRYTDITYGYNAVWRDKSGALAVEIDGWAMEIVGSIRAAAQRIEGGRSPELRGSPCRRGGETSDLLGGLDDSQGHPAINGLFPPPDEERRNRPGDHRSRCRSTEPVGAIHGLSGSHRRNQPLQLLQRVDHGS